MIDADAADGMTLPVEVTFEGSATCTDGGIVVLGNSIPDVGSHLERNALAAVGGGLVIPASAVGSRAVHIHGQVVELICAVNFKDFKRLIETDAADGFQCKGYRRFLLDIIVA